MLLDAVGIEVEGHPVADVSGFSLPEIQALSFHDPTPYRVDLTTVSDAQKAVMAANGTALAVYAGSPAMADPTLLGRLSDIAVPTLVLWGESDQIVEPGYGRAYAASIPGARFEIAAEDRAHAPDGDPRTGSAGDLDRRGVEVLSDGAPPRVGPHCINNNPRISVFPQFIIAKAADLIKNPQTPADTAV